MTGQIQLLKNEIDNDPLARGYSGMSNKQIADSINTADLGLNKPNLTNTEILEAMDPAELIALTGDKAVRVWGVLSIQVIDPFGVAAGIIIDAFGTPSNTVTALAALRVTNTSRAAQLVYPGKVREGHVEMAKAKV